MEVNLSFKIHLKSPLLRLRSDMDIDYQVVVDKNGKPLSALINWADFEKISRLLELGKEGFSFSNDNSEQIKNPAEGDDNVESPAQYKEGGDYKPLSKIGVDLPESLDRKHEAKDKPVIPKPEEHTIRLGKRIR